MSKIEEQTNKSKTNLFYYLLGLVPMFVRWLFNFFRSRSTKSEENPIKSVTKITKDLSVRAPKQQSHSSSEKKTKAEAEEQLSYSPRRSVLSASSQDSIASSITDSSSGEKITAEQSILSNSSSSAKLAAEINHLTINLDNEPGYETIADNKQPEYLRQAHDTVSEIANSKDHQENLLKKDMHRLFRQSCYIFSAATNSYIQKTATENDKIANVLNLPEKFNIKYIQRFGQTFLNMSLLLLDNIKFNNSKLDMAGRFYRNSSLIKHTENVFEQVSNILVYVVFSNDLTKMYYQKNGSIVEIDLKGPYKDMLGQMSEIQENGSAIITLPSGETTTVMPLLQFSNSMTLDISNKDAPKSNFRSDSHIFVNSLKFTKDFNSFSEAQMSRLDEKPILNVLNISSRYKKYLSNNNSASSRLTARP